MRRDTFAQKKFKQNINTKYLNIFKQYLNIFKHILKREFCLLREFYHLMGLGYELNRKERLKSKIEAFKRPFGYI